MASGSGAFGGPATRDPLKLQPPIGKQPHGLGDRKYAKRRKDGYEIIQQLGADIAKAPVKTIKLPKLTFDEDQSTGLLRRVIDDKTDERVDDERFGSLYRGAWKKQDELLSTSSVRHLIDGLLDGRKRKQVSDDVWNLFVELIDIVSALRIPTKYSGYATATKVMQHPTKAGEGFFSTLEVAGPHGSSDSRRVKYIGDALRASRAKGDSLDEQLRVVIRAAIEYSLNYFTAPASAANVHPYSTMKNLPITNKKVLEQVGARDRMKDIYRAVGGELSTLAKPETRLESLARNWPSTVKSTKADPEPFAPLSPYRQWQEPASDDESETSTDFGSSLFSTPPVQASTSTTSAPSTSTASVALTLVAPPTAPKQKTTVRSSPMLDDLLAGMELGVRKAKKRARVTTEADAEDEPEAKLPRIGENVAQDTGELRLDLDGSASIDLYGVSAATGERLPRLFYDDFWSVLDPSIPSLIPSPRALGDVDWPNAPKRQEDEPIRDLDGASAPVLEDDDLLEDLSGDVPVIDYPYAPIYRNSLLDDFEEIDYPSAPPYSSSFMDDEELYFDEQAFAPYPDLQPSAPPLEPVDELASPSSLAPMEQTVPDVWTQLMNLPSPPTGVLGRTDVVASDGATDDLLAQLNGISVPTTAPGNVGVGAMEDVGASSSELVEALAVFA